MRFPSIADVATNLREINREVDSDDDGVDVRLCVDNDGTWTVRWGLVDYDPEHSLMCGASSVPGSNRRFNSRDVAKDLIEQCKEQFTDNGGNHE